MVSLERATAKLAAYTTDFIEWFYQAWTLTLVNHLGAVPLLYLFPPQQAVYEIALSFVAYGLTWKLYSTVWMVSHFIILSPPPLTDSPSFVAVGSVCVL